VGKRWSKIFECGQNIWRSRIFEDQEENQDANVLGMGDAGDGMGW
jgi:hypothetical protein